MRVVVVLPAAGASEGRVVSSSQRSVLVDADAFAVDDVVMREAEWTDAEAASAIVTRASEGHRRPSLIFAGPGAAAAFDMVCRSASAAFPADESPVSLQSAAVSDEGKITWQGELGESAAEDGGVRVAVLSTATQRLQLAALPPTWTAAAVASHLVSQSIWGDSTSLVVCATPSGPTDQVAAPLRAAQPMRKLPSGPPVTSGRERELEDELQVVRAQAKTAEDDVAELDAFIETLERKLAAETERADAAEEARAALESGLSAERAAASDAAQHLAGREESRTRLERELSHVNRSLADTLRSAERQLEAKRAVVDDLETRLLSKDEALALARTELAAEKAKAERHWAKQLSLVKEFQDRELEWQREIREADEVVATVRAELAHTRQMLRMQRSNFESAADAYEAERAADDEALAEITARLRQATPELRDRKGRGGSERPARAGSEAGRLLLSPPAEFPSDEEPSIPNSPRAGLPTPHARTLQF